MEALKQQPTQKRLKEWHDLWFSEDKKAGYVAITDFESQLFYGTNDIKTIIRATEGKKKQFISINAFDVKWQERIYSRKREHLKQIRNIAIDVDQYDLKLTIDEALDIMQELIDSKRIPEPNLVLASRGIQLFYSIEGGASPEMSWLARIITEQFISKMKPIGADSKAKDMSRVMRVPNSVNERNGATVEPSIWNDTSYTLQELQSYCRPLDEFGTRQKKQWDISNVPLSGGLIQVYKTNHARLRDFDRLIEARQGDFTGMRNTLLYMYSYHQALVLNTQVEVISSVASVFNEIYSTTAKPTSQIEFERTVRSAYKDAERFFQLIKENGFKVPIKEGDGIIKPYTTTSIIEKLIVTEDEQRLMGSIRSSTIEREQRAAYMKDRRREQGSETREAYEEGRKQQQQAKLDELVLLMNDNPDATKTVLAKELNISRSHLYRLLKLL